MHSHKPIVTKFIALCTAAFILASCSKNSDDTKPALQIPTTYDAANFSANTTTQKAVALQFRNLVVEAQKGRTAGTVVTKTALDNLFTTGNPSLQSLITTYLKGRMEGIGGWFDELAKASGGTYTPSNTITGQGGVFGGYLFDEYGVEMEQLIDKGQFGATLYNYALTLLNNPTAANIDQVLVIYGATPDFSNSGSNNVAADKRDVNAANYAARRSNINDNNSLYIRIKNDFIKLQAAVKAGDDYKSDRDNAIASLKLNWEKAIAATAINYCHSVINTLSQTSPTDAQKGSALHALGEAIGFVHGFRTVADKKITDAEIEEILTLFNAPQNGTAACYKFVTDSANELPKLQTAIQKLKTIYGFTGNEIESFKNNWVNLQNR